MRDKFKIYIAVIFSCLLVVALIVGYKFYGQRFDSSEVKEFYVTNLTSNSATVIWITDQEVEGSVLVDSEEKSNTYFFNEDDPRLFFDDRDTIEYDIGQYSVASVQNKRKIHHVTIRNLLPERSYKFLIRNNNKLFNSDEYYIVTTKVPSQILSPEPVYGRVENVDGSYPTDGIVRFMIQSANGISQEMSTTISTNGTYSFDIQNILTNDLSQPFPENNDNFYVLNFVTYNNSPKSELVNVLPGFAQPVETVIIEEEVAVTMWDRFLRKVNARIANERSNIVLEDEYTAPIRTPAPVRTSTPTPTKKQDRPESTATPTPKTCAGLTGYALDNCMRAQLITATATPTSTSQGNQCAGLSGLAYTNCVSATSSCTSNAQCSDGKVCKNGKCIKEQIACKKDGCTQDGAIQDCRLDRLDGANADMSVSGRQTCMKDPFNNCYKWSSCSGISLLPSDAPTCPTIGSCSGLGETRSCGSTVYTGGIATTTTATQKCEYQRVGPITNQISCLVWGTCITEDVSQDCSRLANSCTKLGETKSCGYGNYAGTQTCEMSANGCRVWSSCKLGAQACTTGGCDPTLPPKACKVMVGNTEYDGYYECNKNSNGCYATGRCIRKDSVYKSCETAPGVIGCSVLNAKTSCSLANGVIGTQQCVISRNDGCMKYSECSAMGGSVGIACNNQYGCTVPNAEKDCLIYDPSVRYNRIPGTQICTLNEADGCYEYNKCEKLFSSIPNDPIQTCTEVIDNIIYSGTKTCDIVSDPNCMLTTECKNMKPVMPRACEVNGCNDLNKLYECTPNKIGQTYYKGQAQCVHDVDNNCLRLGACIATDEVKSIGPCAERSCTQRGATRMCASTLGPANFNLGNFDIEIDEFGTYSSVETCQINEVNSCLEWGECSPYDALINVFGDFDEANVVSSNECEEVGQTGGCINGRMRTCVFNNSTRKKVWTDGVVCEEQEYRSCFQDTCNNNNKIVKCINGISVITNRSCNNLPSFEETGNLFDVSTDQFSSVGVSINSCSSSSAVCNAYCATQNKTGYCDLSQNNGNGACLCDFEDDNSLAMALSNQSVLGASTINNNLESGKYVVQGDSITTQSVYIQDGEKIKFYFDANENGLKDNDEEFIQDELVGSIEFDIQKVPNSVVFDFNKGWNLLSFPFTMKGDGTSEVTTSSDLLRFLNREGIVASSVTAYRAGRFIVHTLRYDELGNEVFFGQEFNILPGEGYFVKTLSPGRTSFEGNQVEGSLGINLVGGWNLVGISNSEVSSFSAFNLLKSMTRDGVNAKIISKWDSGSYYNAVYDNDIEYGNDYEVYPTRGYWIQTSNISPTRFEPK